MIKLVALVAALFGGAYFAGVFDHRYSRVVDRPPSEVLAALGDLDIRDAPGAPATDPSRSGGVAPAFAQETTSTGLVYTVRSGTQVAVRMFADLKPINDGNQTQVTTRIERGDAPDDFVAPAFRSKGVTTGLFNLVVDEKLDDLTRPKANPERCRELAERFQNRMPSQDAMHQDSLKDAMGDTARAMMQLSAMEQELRRNGCKTDNASGEFRPVQDQIRP